MRTSHRQRTGKGIGLLLAACVMMGAGGLATPAHACISDQLDSVHFHSSPPDFGLPPRRAVLSWRGEHDDRPGAEEGSGDKPGLELLPDGEEEEAARKRHAQEIAGVEALEDRGAWQEALQQLTQTASADGWSGLLRDRVQIIQRLKKFSAPTPALMAAYRRYRQGLDDLEVEKLSEAQDAFEQIYRDTNADFLRVHACYQLASLAWQWLDNTRAISLYQGMLKEFPQEPKREDALIMLARCAVLPFTPAGCDPKLGKEALDQLEREFPHSRFRQTAVGLRGRMHFLAGEYAAAFQCYRSIGDSRSVEIMLPKMQAGDAGKFRVWLLASYLRRLTRAHTYDDYAQAIIAIDRTEGALTPQEAKQFSALLRSDPELPDPYLYYRLNHTSLDAGGRKSLARLADAIIAAHPNTRLSPTVRARLAEVFYRNKQYAKALSWVEEQKTAAQPYDLALYVRGAALQKLGRNSEALAEFRTLLTRCPQSGMRHAAREEVAILCEALGDRIGALEQYFELDYTADIAYLLDCRMSIAEVEASLSRFNTGHHMLNADRYYEVAPEGEDGTPSVRYSRQELLLYTLGVLELRADHWDAAERWFKQLKAKRVKLFSEGRKKWESRPSPDPLTATHDLRRLNEAAQNAPDENARAVALYKLATYYYSHGTLLLYNPLLWKETRAWNYGAWLDTKRLNAQDIATTRAYMYRHEVYARSLQICREIAQRYPNSAVAPQALYRGACSARYLANFNGWWREENKAHNFWKEAAQMMHACAARYPHNPLAKEAAKYSKVFDQERKDAWDENARAALPPRNICYAQRTDARVVKSVLAQIRTPGTQ